METFCFIPPSIKQDQLSFISNNQRYSRQSPTINDDTDPTRHRCTDHEIKKKLHDVHVSFN